MIDIKRLAIQCNLSCDSNESWRSAVENLTKFAEAYHAMKCAEADAVGKADSEKEANKLLAEITELKAQNSTLREALEDTNVRFDEMCDVFSKGATAADRNRIANNYAILKFTPQQSLAEYRNSVIEECAETCEANYDSVSSAFGIRALKSEVK